MSESEYRKTAAGSDTQFDITPAKPPKPMGLIILMGIFGFVIVLVLFAAAPGVGLLGLILYVGLMWYFVGGGKIAKAYRAPASFRVNPEGITVAGRTFAKADIHRLIIKNHMFPDEAVASTSNTLILIPIPASTALASGMASGYRSKIGRISYRLDLEAGGKATTLATGMDETTANGLLTDVGRVLGLS